MNTFAVGTISVLRGQFVKRNEGRRCEKYSPSSLWNGSWLRRMLRSWVSKKGDDEASQQMSWTLLDRWPSQSRNLSMRSARLPHIQPRNFLDSSDKVSITFTSFLSMGMRLRCLKGKRLKFMTKAAAPSAKAAVRFNKNRKRFSDQAGPKHFRGLHRQNNSNVRLLFFSCLATY